MNRTTEQDVRMRADGFVTAEEVADAVGKALSSIHRGLDEGRIPGRSVGPESYRRRYVAIHAYLARGDYVGDERATGKLLRLAQLVGKQAPAEYAAAAKKPRTSAPKTRRKAPARAGR